MTTIHDTLWLDLRECQKVLDNILKSNLIQRQTTPSARRDSHCQFCKIQERLDDALYHLEHKRNRWWWKLRRAICGDRLRGEVEALLRESRALEAGLRKGAT